MIKLEFNNKPTLKVTEVEFEKIINSIGLNWYGVQHITTNDILLIEDTFDIALDIKHNGDIVLHDINYVWVD